MAELFKFVPQELHARELVGPSPVVSQARRGQTPLVAHVRVEINGLVAVRQDLSLCKNRGIPRKVFGQEVSICGTPTRGARRWCHAHRCTDGAALCSGGGDRDLRATDES